MPAPRKLFCLSLWTVLRLKLDPNLVNSKVSPNPCLLRREVTPLATLRESALCTIASRGRIPLSWMKKPKGPLKMTTSSISSASYLTRIHCTSSMDCRQAQSPTVNALKRHGWPLHARKSKQGFRTMLATKSASTCLQSSATKSLNSTRRRLVWQRCSSGLPRNLPMSCLKVKPLAKECMRSAKRKLLN